MGLDKAAGAVCGRRLCLGAETGASRKPKAGSSSARLRPAPQQEGRFTAGGFSSQVEERQALCPAGKTNTQCSRLVEQPTGKMSFRFELSTQCHACPLREPVCRQGNDTAR